MSDDEVDELLKAVDTSSGEINYTGMFMSMFMFAYLDFEMSRFKVIANTCPDLVRTILAN
jgi:hypothetical protein